MNIRNLPVENRPRERLEAYGAAGLSDAELWAIILRTGTKEDNVIDLSNRLILEYGIDKLASCSLKDLQKIKGIGRAKACQVLAVFELNKRIHLNKIRDRPLCCAKDVFDYVSPRFLGAEKECFAVIHLDSKNRAMKYETVVIGILDSSVVHPREIFKSAIKENDYAVILVHNHPSGDATPSEEDEAVSELMFATGKVLFEAGEFGIGETYVNESLKLLKEEKFIQEPVPGVIKRQ